jgi:hypothetical protein
LLVELRSPGENGYSELLDGRLRRKLPDREICYARRRCRS